jgi:hypothetical protein
MASPKIFTGKDGSFIFDGNTQLHVRNWTVEGSLGLLDVTVLSQDTVNNEAGLKSFSGNCTVMYHEDDTSLAGMLDNIFLGGEPLKAKASFRWSNKKIEFNAFITSANISASAGEIITADVSFTSSGDVTAVTL